MIPKRVIYQFPISHYCEKTRWNLDAMGLSFGVRNVIPGWHLVALRWVGGGRTVPVLVDGQTVVGDSTAIARYLDRTYADRCMLPPDEADRGRALELEGYFSDRIGGAVRQWIYGQFGERPGGMAERLFAAYPPLVRRIGRLVAPALEANLRRMYQIGASGIAEARSRIEEGFERIERETKGDPARYLVGDRLSIADITAASILAPVVAPAGSPWARTSATPSTPRSILELQEELAQRPGSAWVEARYAKDRRSA